MRLRDIPQAREKLNSTGISQVATAKTLRGASRSIRDYCFAHTEKNIILLLRIAQLTFLK